VVLRETHESIRRDLARLRQAAYAAALIEQTSEAETPLPEEFRLYSEFLSDLAGSGAHPKRLLAFEFKLLAHLGQSPKLGVVALAEGSRRFAERMTIEPWNALSQLHPSADQLRELKQFLHGFLIFHLGRIPKGRAAALTSSDAKPGPGG
jgi:recombinational DNA repair protein (RecF pathway)